MRQRQRMVRAAAAVLACFAWSAASFVLPPARAALSVLVIAPQAARAAGQLDTSGMAQVGLLGALLFAGLAVFTFAKPEQEDWQKEIDEVMTEQEWKRSDGPSLCQRCGFLCVNGYCPNCTGIR
ncbi:unnamed protein product [Effrenium voratum]|nr:unnamed protein product [Effrenium voratum]